ncbi:MAG: MMPL family transporter, partial [Thermoanaerobaculia bacterium]
MPSFIVRNRHPITILWFVLAAVLLPNALDLPDRLRPSSRLDIGEAAQVDAVLREAFAGLGGRQAILVIEGVPDITAGRGREFLARVTDALTADPLILSVVSALDWADPLLLGKQGDGTIVMVGVSPDVPIDVVVNTLRAITRPLAAEIREQFGAAQLLWTGDVALDYDSLLAGNQDVREAEARALPVAFALLLWAFGAVVAAVCPLLMAVLAIGLAFGATALIGLFWAPTILLQNITSLLGLALGIDYALLIVTRFREELSQDSNPLAAAERMLRHAGRSVLLSGATVAIGFSALLVVPVQEPRSIGVGGLLVTLFAVLLATTLLPALLVWLGPRVNLGRIGRRALPPQMSTSWYRWGLWVTRRPILILLC